MELPEQEGPGVTFWKYIGKVARELCVQADEPLVSSEDSSVPWQECSRDPPDIKGIQIETFKR